MESNEENNEENRIRGVNTWNILKAIRGEWGGGMVESK